MSKSIAAAPAHKVAPNAVQTINRLHRQASEAAVHMAVYAAVCGMELAKARKFTPHGGWDDFIANHCDFTIRTASRYMALGEAIKGRLVKSDITVSDLLDLAPSELDADQQGKLMALVAQATDGGTITGLYQEFGIVRRVEGGPTGSYRVNETLVQTFLRAYHAELLGKPYAELPADVQEHFRKWMRQVEVSDTQMALDFYEVTVSRFDEYAPKRREIIDKMPAAEKQHLATTLEAWLNDLRA